MEVILAKASALATTSRMCQLCGAPFKSSMGAIAIHSPLSIHTKDNTRVILANASALQVMHNKLPEGARRRGSRRNFATLHTPLQTSFKPHYKETRFSPMLYTSSLVLFIKRPIVHLALSSKDSLFTRYPLLLCTDKHQTHIPAVPIIYDSSHRKPSIK